MSSPKPLAGRIAPSPTGRLHVGHARSFLIAWWSIRSRGGRMLLRIDDLDHTRVKPGMLDACLADLEWLGLDWDDSPVLQSERREEHQAAVELLLDQGQAYACVCTRREIEQALSAPHQSEQESAYPGTCRDLYGSPEEAESKSGRRAGIRLRVPGGNVDWQDEFLGPRSTPVAAQVGDFLIARRDQVFAYQLACAVDDAAMGISEVLRGADLASSAPRQLLIQQALGLPSPSWAHVPLVTDRVGRRLAKRDGDITLSSLREARIDPRSLIAWIANTCGMQVAQRASASELIAGFNFSNLPKNEVHFDQEQLLNLKA